MTPGTDIATSDANELELTAEQQAAADAIARAQAAEYSDEPLQTPILKIGQALTKEVEDGNAERGDFINTLTNESLGTAIEFISAFYQKGRFASDDKSGRAFVAFSDTIPASWEPLVGREFVGTPFVEYPEAEEQYARRVNDEDGDLHEQGWGHGPLVSTTHNYTGLVLAEDGEGGIDYQPARLSLKRIDVPAHKKLQTLFRAVLRNKPQWDAVIRLTTQAREFGKNKAYTINPSDIRIVRKTDPTEKLLGLDVAQAASAGRTQSTGAEDALQDKPAAVEEPDDALAVG